MLSQGGRRKRAPRAQPPWRSADNRPRQRGVEGDLMGILRGSKPSEREAAALTPTEPPGEYRRECPIAGARLWMMIAAVTSLPHPARAEPETHLSSLIQRALSRAGLDREEDPVDRQRRSV